MSDEKTKEMHIELITAIKEKDYENICKFLHTNHFESDSDFTILRCNDSFIQGYKEAEKIFQSQLSKAMKAIEVLEKEISTTYKILERQYLSKEMIKELKDMVENE